MELELLQNSRVVTVRSFSQLLGLDRDPGSKEMSFALGTKIYEDNGTY